MTNTDPPPDSRAPRALWKPLFAGGCLGMVLGIVLFMGAVLVAYNFQFQKSVKKMAEVQELKPVQLRADYTWTVTAPDGTTLDLQTLQGRPVFLHLWRPECVSCVAEVPSINTLYEEFHERGIAFVSIAVEAQDDLGVALAVHDVRFPVYTAAAIPETFKTASTPTTYILDRAGFIVYHHTGAVNWDTPDARAFLEHLGGE